MKAQLLPLVVLGSCVSLFMPVAEGKFEIQNVRTSPSAAGASTSVGTGHATHGHAPQETAAQDSTAQDDAVQDGAVDELHRQQEALRQTLQGFAAMNPFGQNSGQGLGHGHGAPPELGPQAERLQRLIANPWIQKYVRLVNHPDFLSSAESILTHPNRMLLIWVELGFFVFFLVFRAWRLSKSKHWLRALWTRTYTYVMYFGGAAIVVPALVIGSPFTTLLKTAFLVFTKQ